MNGGDVPVKSSENCYLEVRDTYKNATRLVQFQNVLFWGLRKMEQAVLLTARFWTHPEHKLGFQ